MERMLGSAEELGREAGRFAAGLAPAASGATLVTLSGELGAGKTAFAQSVARALGVTDAVTSPTFVLEKVYGLPDATAFSRLVHIDAYRLGSGADLAPLAFGALMEDPANLILLEWPERVADGLPEPAHRITLEVLPDSARKISYA